LLDRIGQIKKITDNNRSVKIYFNADDRDKFVEIPGEASVVLHLHGLNSIAFSFHKWMYEYADLFEANLESIEEIDIDRIRSASQNVLYINAMLNFSASLLPIIEGPFPLNISIVTDEYVIILQEVLSSMEIIHKLLDDTKFKLSQPDENLFELWNRSREFENNKRNSLDVLVGIKDSILDFDRWIADRESAETWSVDLVCDILKRLGGDDLEANPNEPHGLGTELRELQPIFSAKATPQEIGKRIRAKRKEKGWSQQRLAEEMNLKTYRTVQNIESGGQSQTISTIQKAMAALQVDSL